jgi:hypothetical protein
MGCADGSQAMEFAQLEETIARLPSVLAVRVTGRSTRPEEIHVLAVPEKTAKQVVRDVQTLIMARFGLDIDRRIVSVVQIGPDQIPSADDRPAIIGVHEIPEGTRVTVAVTLRWHGEDYVGTATGPAAGSARLRLVGEPPSPRWRTSSWTTRWRSMPSGRPRSACGG